MQKKYNIAVVGATGAVGTEMLRVLEQLHFPVNHLLPLASKRSAGRSVRFRARAHKVQELKASSFNGIDIALFSAGAKRSLEFAPEAVKRGAVVVDNSSAYRMHKGVPLVVPEVNPHAVKKHHGIIANPNCSTIILVVPLTVLHDAAKIRRITVATYQSVSGAGMKAMLQLQEESVSVLKQCRVKLSHLTINSKLKRKSSHSALPRQIAFNAIAQVDVFGANRYTKEEMKMVNETQKILEDPTIGISATCVRVPVFISHAEAVWIETAKPLSVSRALTLMKKARGVRVLDDPAKGHYPDPLDPSGKDAVFVGRVRKDKSVRNGLALWVCGDNLRKGAALNAVQIAQLLTRGNTE